MNANLKARVAGETGEMEEPQTGEVQILLKSDEDPVSMRALGVGTLIFPFSLLKFLASLSRLRF